MRSAYFRWTAVAVGTAIATITFEPIRPAAQSPPARQTGRPLAFEVGVIKPTKSVSGGVTGGCRGIDSRLAANDPRLMVPLGRCVITAGRLSHMMAIAFEMPLQRISGFPGLGWADALRPPGQSRRRGHHDRAAAPGDAPRVSDRT